MRKEAVYKMTSSLKKEVLDVGHSYHIDQELTDYDHKNVTDMKISAMHKIKHTKEKTNTHTNEISVG